MVMRGKPQRVAGGNKERKKTTKVRSFNISVENVTPDRIIAGMSYVDHLEGKISTTRQHLGLVLMEI